MEEKDRIIVKWAQEDVETSKNLLSNNNKEWYQNMDWFGLAQCRYTWRVLAHALKKQ